VPVLFGLVVFLVACFGLTVFRGAPYVPTHKHQVEVALDLLSLEPGGTLVDLGSGDGVVLLAAAQRGLRVYGYEINPVLCLVAWWRCRKYRTRVTIRWRDFWLAALPPSTKAIFVFAAGPYITKLERKLVKFAAQQNKRVLVASYGFALPNQRLLQSRDGVLIYEFKP